MGIVRASDDSCNNACRYSPGRTICRSRRSSRIRILGPKISQFMRRSTIADLRDEASRRDAGLDEIMGTNTDQAKRAAAWNI